MTPWRLLDPGPLPAWRQMALDSVVIRARADNRVPDTLRFMEFEPHTALVGYHQAVDLEINRQICDELGVEINRRITGGGAIYMDARQLGWEMCLGQDNAALPRDPDAVYRTLSRVVVETLAAFGIAARFRPVNDVEVAGRKISGTGGVEWGDALIYQGTLLVDFDVETMLRVLRLAIEKLTDKEVLSFQQRIVTMAELLGAAPAMTVVKAEVVRAVQKVLEVTVYPESLTTEEEADWLRVQDSFRQPDWIDRRVARLAGYDVKTAQVKAPGGLLRAQAAVDADAGRIRKVFLTGDFFVYPERAPLDLEASLKDCPLEAAAVHERVAAHYAEGYRYLGVSVDDWFRVIVQAAGLDGKGESDGHHQSGPRDRSH
ncbi:MAG: lipoate--protein ligase family protein [Thermaerobacter sp.]|nr:lipoate--protein ligase family protein [Thermaerobacter sp.]